MVNVLRRCQEVVECVVLQRQMNVNGRPATNEQNGSTEVRKLVEGARDSRSSSGEEGTKEDGKPRDWAFDVSCTHTKAGDDERVISIAATDVGDVGNVRTHAC